MVGYYCCFVKDFFKIVRFLYEFIFGGKKLIKKKKVKWIFILELWIKECDDVFEILKQKFIFLLVFGYFDFKCEFIVEIDVSMDGFGVVLL